MSEPVSNAEIEDVLSSIRRLVSENTDTPRPVSARDENAKKLVLTPAFRVLEGHGSEPEPSSEGQDADATTAEQTEEDSELQNASETIDDSVDTTDLGQKIAALEAAISDSHEEWEPDGSEQEATEAEPIILQRAAPAHTIEALRPEFVEIPDDPPQKPVDVDTASPIEEAEIVADDEPDDILAEDAGDGAFLDEEMLREMVTQLVREELKGHIGERITRNVRRLVHREIRRAMAVRDLE